MVAAIDALIAHYRHCRSQLRYVPANVLSAGRDIFTSDAAVVLWLCEPAKALDDAIPISLMRHAKGRARVVGLLHAIAHGVYL
jgi:putative toxin-antitoxin system antitoxin component (TIGR02293 family)